MAYVLPNVLLVVTTADVCILVVVLLLELLPSVCIAYMFCIGAYPCCAYVFRRPTAIRRCWYAPWTNNLSNVHLLLAVVSQSSNSSIGKIPDWRRRCTVFLINCVSEYGLCTIIATSWHCSTLRNNNSGASLGIKSNLNNLSLFHIKASLAELI
jgi:hypothetical protein